MAMLGELVDIMGGGTPSRKVADYWGGDIPWATVKDFKGLELVGALESITQDGLKNSASNLIPAGCIIVPTRMAVGKAAINLVDMAINQDLKALRIKNSKIVNQNYLFRILLSKSDYLESRGKGATVKGITLDVLRELDIPLPPLKEQKRIAAILDKADAIRRKRQQAIDLTDQLLRSVFLDMFGDPVTNPKGWEICPLSSAIAHANNGLSRRRKTFENVGDIVLRLQDVHYDGIRFEKDLNRILLDDKEKLRYKLDDNDILFIRVNGNPEYVGRSAVFHEYVEDVYHNDHIIRIKLSEEYDADFLCYLLNYPGSRNIISTQIKTSAGQHTISQGGIEKLMFYRPPVELQEKFAVIRSRIKKLPYELKGAESLFGSLTQEAFNGKLTKHSEAA